MPIIAPWREWDIKTREEEIEYADARHPRPGEEGSSVFDGSQHLASLSRGLRSGRSANEPPRDLPLICKYPEDAPDKPEYVTIDFEQGIPVAVNGEKDGRGEAAGNLQKSAQRRGHCGHGGEPSGGMKSRGVYETPAERCSYAAHRNLEEITVDRDTAHYKDRWR